MPDPTSETALAAPTLPEPASLSPSERLDLLRTYRIRHRDAAAGKEGATKPTAVEMRHVLDLIRYDRSHVSAGTKRKATAAPTKPISLDDFT